MDRAANRFKILKIDLAIIQLTAEEVSLADVTQVAFVRYASKTQGSLVQKFNQDFLQISIDGSPYFPFKPGDKISVPPGSSDRFHRLRYRVLRGVSAWCFLMLGTDFCTYGLGPHEEIAQPLKNLTDSDVLLTVDYATPVNVAAGATGILLFRTIPSNYVALVYGCSVSLSPLSTQVNHIMDIYKTIPTAGIVKSWHAKGSSAGYQGNLAFEFPHPLEITNAQTNDYVVQLRVRNLHATDAALFFGNLEVGLIPVYSNWNWPEEQEGR